MRIASELILRAALAELRARRPPGRKLGAVPNPDASTCACLQLPTRT